VSLGTRQLSPTTVPTSALQSAERTKRSVRSAQNRLGISGTLQRIPGDSGDCVSARRNARRSRVESISGSFVVARVRDPGSAAKQRFDVEEAHLNRGFGSERAEGDAKGNCAKARFSAEP